MYQITRPLFLICETPLHAGTGDDLGFVDLPIQRERHTDFPKIESSSLKGALREAFEHAYETFKNVRTDEALPEEEHENKAKAFASWEANDVKVHRVFGFDDGSMKKATANRLKKLFKYKEYKEDGDDKAKDGHEFAGCLALTDARLLLFPVKSMKGVFVWITCKSVLAKLEHELKIANINNELKQTLSALVPKLAIGQQACRASNANEIGINDKTIVLEEYAFEVKTDTEDLAYKFAGALAKMLFTQPEQNYWQLLLKNRLVILSDDDFRDFVKLSTEVVTRTKIDNQTGTVATGALFTEEYLPTESILYSLAMFTDERGKKATLSANEVQEFVTDTLAKQLNHVFQLGANTTLGKGVLRTHLL
ncbi:MAG TPA: type III-B CRISPR module RAMP protein Cmr4 [Chitinophagales bacterium]|nr:type III-B CRISPR module RAMP protein Cmr4 [Chitinophagales bacterium]HRK26236.1 type III-B CRISPR module RAMP protein Cmr4 [Chitinophagales bacterium]